MSKKNILFLIIFISLLVLILFYFKFRYLSKPILYNIDSCFIDKELDVKFKVLDVDSNVYKILVVDSGHYSMSPDYFKGSELMYSRDEVENKKDKYHHALCENEISN